MEKSHSVRGSIHHDFLQNPFDTPDNRSSVGRPLSVHSVSTSRFSQLGSRPRKQRKFKSARLVGPYEKPWLERRDPRKIWDRIIFLAGTVLGLGIAAYIVYTGWISVDNPDYCLVFSDDFSNGVSTENWSYEQQVGGFGAHSFDWTTDDTKNVYADASGLHLVPTLTTQVTDITEAQLLDGYTLNLTTSGVCTSTDDGDCARVSNSTKGTIINPVRSARINTKGKHSIRYGKVEVTAKLPRGDWIWPAIWMMPEDSVYGDWPRSGEIDIMESRGNDRNYNGGRNEVAGTLHWGPETSLDAYWRTSASRNMKRGDYSDDFHIYGVEWSDSYIYTYVDNRLVQSLYMPFGSSWGSLYDRGYFGSTTVNASIPTNPWASSSSKTLNAPFDQSFYLILNVAVGTTGGYFADGYGQKPWVDTSEKAMHQFWNARDAWLPTWGSGDQKGLTVKNVNMWSRGKC
ncbi:putative gram-negative bacteria binding protein [Truncatella angustata]|uniref:Gram-negative bacteria binding protein n=1 Tax=Truncatella angustata TaxID=152316 RepID=A0A9P8ZYI4_9PEZI|nr:putative gram-negative bacteria binding protein [Truncatella angustata]KAH6656076.1 putative gram-negative bacteria binding protein [Truncatella angustata]